MLSVAALAVNAFAACDSEVREPPFLREPTPTVTVGVPDDTVAPPADFESFRRLAPEIETAIRGRNADFFLGVAQTSSVTCPHEFEPRCEGQPEGTVVEGVSLGFWRSEGSLLTREEMRDDLAQYFRSLNEPALHALAWGPEADAAGPTAYAVAVSTDDPENTTRVLGFVPQDGAWRMLQVIVVPVLADEWLSGDCTDCYDHWERWDG